MFRMLGRIGGWVVLIVILIAIWRANNGDLTSMIDNTWKVLNQGADILTTVWNNITGGTGDLSNVKIPDTTK
jgi:hypothetical protein